MLNYSIDIQVYIKYRSLNHFNKNVEQVHIALVIQGWKVGR